MWTSFQKFATLGVSFVSSIILARLLTPFDYGCIGMLAIFMVLSDTLIDGGFGSALIQKKGPTPSDYSTIFIWNISVSIIVYFILFLSSPAIAHFYGIPLLSDVLRVQGLVLFINAFNLVQRTQLRKQMNFKLLSIVTIITSLVALFVTSFLAYEGLGVWSLVAQNFIIASVPAIVFWFYVKWRPIMVFSKRSFKDLFSFGLFVFLSQLVNQVGAKLTGLLIGKIYNPSTLGFYTKASTTESLASSSISSIMAQITYPLYSKVQDNKIVLTNIIKRLTVSIAYITFPLMCILMLTAKPLFVLLYTEKWLASVPLFQALCLVGLADCLQAVNTQSIAAIGKSRIMFYWTLVKRGVGLTFIFLGLFFYGMKGLLCGVIIYNWFCYFVNIGLVSKYIGYNWKTQLLDIAPIALFSGIVASICFFSASLLRLDLYLDGLFKVSLYIILYIGWSIIRKPDSYLYLKEIMPSVLKQRKNQNDKNW